MAKRRNPNTFPLTTTRLCEVALYDELTGYFKPVGCARGTRYDQPLGSASKATGYRTILIDGVNYPASYLAWYWVHGRWPARLLDHINGNRDDNRIDNLREVDRIPRRPSPEGSRRQRGSVPRPTHCTCGTPIEQPLQPTGRRLYCAECVRLRGIQRVVAWQRRTPEDQRRRNPAVFGGGRRKTPKITQAIEAAHAAYAAAAIKYHGEFARAA